MKGEIMDTEGIIIVKNVWCGCCGKQEFIMSHSFLLTCIHCESEMKFSYMSGSGLYEWYVYNAPAIPHAPDSTDRDRATRTGIEWIPYENSDTHHARIKYNCNTGNLLGDEMVIRKLKESKDELLRKKDGLLREVEKIEYKIRVEENIGR